MPVTIIHSTRVQNFVKLLLNLGKEVMLTLFEALDDGFLRIIRKVRTLNYEIVEIIS